MTDFPDWQTAAQAAEQIALAGVPLLSKSKQLLNLAGKGILGGGTYQSALIPVTQVGYELVIAAATNGAPTVPFCEVYLFWYDSTSGFSVEVETFFIPVANSVATIQVAGSGPTRADQLQVRITNRDAAVACSVTTAVMENSRVYQRSDQHWVNYWSNGVTIPGYTLAGLASDNSVLGLETGAVVPAGTTITRMVGMGSGRPATLTVNLGGAALASTLVNLWPLPASTYGNSPVMVPSQPPADDYSAQFIAPHTPMALEITNNAAAAITVSWTVIQQQ